MKGKFAVSTITLIVVLLALTACSPVSSPAATQATYADPFAYCAAVGQIDTPDVRYTGPKMSEALFKDYLRAAGLDPNANYPDAFKQMTIWRCMDHKLYACNFGANIPCDSKADTNKTPTQAMADFCKQSPDSTFIPASVTGHATIYGWQCNKGIAEIAQQLGTVDAAGYESNFWQVVEPAP